MFGAGNPNRALREIIIPRNVEWCLFFLLLIITRKLWKESDSFLFLSKTEGLISAFWRTPVIPSRIGQKKRTARDGLLVIVCFNRWVTSKRYISLPLSLCPWSKTTTHQGQHGPPIGCVRDEPTESSRPQRRRRRRRRIRRETSLVSISPKREMAFFFCLNASATPRPKHGRVVIFRHQLQREEENGQR